MSAGSDLVLLSDGLADPNYIKFHQKRKPRQWIAKCLNEGCQSATVRNHRMHSQIRSRDLNGRPNWWNDRQTFVRCNNCGTVRVVEK